MERIDLRPYTIVTDDIVPGGTERVNHDGCSAGEDTRRRLYLTRPIANPTTIIAYCHNCQCNGFSGNATHEHFRDERHQGTPSDYVKDWVMLNFEAPKGLVTKLSDWPVHAQGWVYKNKMNAPLMEGYGLAYDPSSDRVYIPRYKQTTKLLGHNLQAYQLRNTDSKKNIPKYLTVCSEEDNGHTIMYGETHSDMPSPIMVIVEDYVSGIAVSEAFVKHKATVHVLVNYGTKVSIEALHCVARYDNILVWLDNDSGHVREQAQHMARTVSMMNSKANVEVCMVTDDPKHLGANTIQLEIEAWDWHT